MHLQGRNEENGPRTKILSFKLSRFLLSYNSTPQTTTGISPVELLINRKIKAILDFGIPHQISVTERMKQQQGINNHHKLGSILEFQEGNLVLTTNLNGCVDPLFYLIQLGSGKWRHMSDNIKGHWQ